jgi:uncharacterized membrane-anchored protein YitT (DUF2179 family)
LENFQFKPLHIKRAAATLIGAVITAIGLEAFLVDGGVVGISIISAYTTGLPIGIFLLGINLPFIYLGYKRLGRLFAIYSVFGVLVLSIVTTLLHSKFHATPDPILAAIFGGAIVGTGVGLVIRYGGTMDGSEIVAILIDKKSPFSVGEIIMFINIFIIGTAGLVFGWEKAMYSFIAYFVAIKVIDITVEGLDEYRSVWIVSKEYVLIGASIQEELGRKVTYVNARSGKKLASDGVILSVITRIEEQKLKEIVRYYDPKAFIVINNVHEVMGRNYSIRPHTGI